MSRTCEKIAARNSEIDEYNIEVTSESMTSGSGRGGIKSTGTVENGTDGGDLALGANGTLLRARSLSCTPPERLWTPPNQPRLQERDNSGSCSPG